VGGTRTIVARRALIADEIVGPVAITLDGGAIGAVEVLAPGDPRTSGEMLEDGVLSPGLVDLQVNGGFGSDLSTCDAAAWDVVLARFAEAGTTSVLPTFPPASMDRLTSAARRAAERMGDGRPGLARVLGAHVEGPFLSPSRRGAHDATAMRDPSPGLVEELTNALGGALRVMTVAPERRGAMEAIRALVEAGVVVAIGHSDADVPTTRTAADAGASMVTHLWNAASGMSARVPGVTGAALDDDRLVLALIADGHHVDETILRIVMRIADGRVALVSDAVAHLGLASGHYTSGGREVIVREDEPPRLADGTIAGAGTTLAGAVRVLVRAGLPLHRALVAATRVPADSLGETRHGRIEAGAHADLVWFDAELEPSRVWLAGEPVLHSVTAMASGATAPEGVPS
jgi:N-acetylglucosamine-6-phosphate deacetylase